MPGIIVPVGFDNGPRYPADPTETFHYEILLQADAVDVPPADYRVWALAFPDIESHRSLSFTREKLAALAADPATPAANVEESIALLVETGLLAEFEPDTTSAVKFLENHRLAPLAVGMGCTEEDPFTFRIGRGGEAILQVSSDTYSIWTLAFSAPNIWQAVQDLAGDPPDTPNEDVDLAYMFASVVPVLVSLELAYLQPT